MSGWAFAFPLGFVALYERERDGKTQKYTLPVVGAVCPQDGDPRFGQIMVPCPAASPDAGYVVAAREAMRFEEGWTFKGIGYAEADTQEQGDEDEGPTDAAAGS